MSSKIFILAFALFACQVNAQGIVRPFAAGFVNGFNDLAKQFLQYRQPPPVNTQNEFINGPRRPPFSQWVSYPAQMIPQQQPTGFEGFEAIPGMAGFFQGLRPSPVFRPQTPLPLFGQQPSNFFGPRPPFESVSGQPGFVRPPRPFPSLAPAPTATASASSEESIEVYRPSNLLIKPETEASRPEQPTTLEAVAIQRPLDIDENKH